MHEWASMNRQIVSLGDSTNSEPQTQVTLENVTYGSSTLAPHDEHMQVR